MTPAELIRYRLHNQLLTQHPYSEPADIVRWFGAVQAQDYYGAQWALGIRLPGSKEADIESALDKGQIIRSWSLRGTWHYMAPEDVQWMLSLASPRLANLYGSYYRKFGLDDKTLLKSKKIIVDALQGGKKLGRKDLVKTFEQKGISTEGLRGNFLLLRAALDGLICQGPRIGKEISFVLLEEWIKARKKLNPEEALAEITTRYFQSHSPATLKDFCWWSGLSTIDAKKGIEICRSILQEEKAGDSVLYVNKNSTPIKNARSGVYLLPAFDEFMVAYNDRSFLLDKTKKLKVVPGVFEMLAPGIFDDGFLQGNWKRTLKKEKVIIEHSPFVKLTKADKDKIIPAAQKYSRFLGLDLQFS